MQKRLLVTGGSGFIGTNFIDAALKSPEYLLCSIDTADPKLERHRPFFRRCDLLDLAAAKRVIEEFRPTDIVHFAGRTDMSGASVAAYAANHIGTEKLIEATRAVDSVQRVVFTSSQFVVGPGPLPKNDEDFRPHTIYGESKVLSERAVRASRLPYTWTIIRPTNIWGKWHPRYPDEFWRILKQGRYFHPGGRPVKRSYGYAGTVAEQVLRILHGDSAVMDGKVFYSGDAPIDLIAWTNAFSLAITGKPVRVVPHAAVLALAKIGDLVIKCGGNFPIFSSRYRSMTQDYVTPMDHTFQYLGTPTISMAEGVRETVAWLRTSAAPL